MCVVLSGSFSLSWVIFLIDSAKEFQTSEFPSHVSWNLPVSHENERCAKVSPVIPGQLSKVSAFMSRFGISYQVQPVCHLQISENFDDGWMCTV